MRALLLATVMLGVIGLAADRLSAQLSPGELSSAHAALDSSRACLECHEKGKGVTAQRCLSCHGVLGERIAAGAGLHARSDYQRCETCHIEHHGREFELIWWGKGTESPPEGWQMERPPDGGQSIYFDHDDTGYSLLGAHRVACRDCHRASHIEEPEKLIAAGKDLDRTFLGLATECATCHQDPHRGQMATRGCAECHGQDAWQPAAGFDHDQTAFALDGRHASTECTGCHVTETDEAGDWIRYAGTPTACADCHDDPHRGRLGRDCAACHATADWRRVDRGRFDHDLTRFPLRGRHRPLDCASCHAAGSFRIAGHERCATCHADEHSGQLRAACSECHDVDGFVPSGFDLDDHAATDFPLEAAHRTVPCADCHARVPTSDLVARGVAVAMDSAPATTRVFRLDAAGCVDCHLDPHAGTADAFLGEAGCETCHDGASWRVAERTATGEIRFDHGATGFDLEGAHRTVVCVECHELSSAPVTGDVMLSFQGASTTCWGCHQDPHLGQVARPEGPVSCRDCHSPEGWTPSLFDHGRDSVFPLEGAHARAACEACHPTETVEGRDVVLYKPLPTACSGCHRAPEETGTASGGVAR
ncbi:MAG: hypothetical protein GY719_30440 [bacterium]|nr:hypothetical protein [bacterium]